jgi:uncharacterized protein (TIGR03083 family)
MDRDEIWQVIDDQRLSLADLFDDLSADEWRTPSLCHDWRVRDVAAHLTLAQMGAFPAMVALSRARGNLDRMIRDTAVRQARLPAGEYADLLRAMTGSRKKAPGITDLEPLIDVLVHGQDIALPLDRVRPMPASAAAAAATRAWSMGRPFHAERKLTGLRLAATDHPWQAGQGPVVEGPIAAILLLITGRPAALSRLSGPGMTALHARLSPSPAQRRVSRWHQRAPHRAPLVLGGSAPDAERHATVQRPAQARFPHQAPLAYLFDPIHLVQRRSGAPIGKYNSGSC